MPSVLWDASALAKRYTEEVGDDVVDAIFAATPIPQMALTPMGFAETYSILLRRRNDGTLGGAAFDVVTAKLRTEVLGDPGFSFLTIFDAYFFGCLSVMQAHNINASDAAILATYLRYAQAVSENEFWSRRTSV